MNSDFFLAKPPHKKICQDYIAIRDDEISLSDGCGGARETDVGARIVACADWDSLASCQYREMVEWLRLPPESLYCTSLRLKVVDQGKAISFRRIGDGYLIEGHEDYIRCTRYYYAVNAPFYIGYDIYNEVERYLDIPNNGLTTEITEFDKNFVFKNKLTTYTEEPENLLAAHTLIPTKGLDWIAVTSDGLDSFSTPIEDVLKAFFLFKNFNGCFVQRRAQVAMREFESEGVSFHDDLSIGVINLASI